MKAEEFKKEAGVLIQWLRELVKGNLVDAGIKEEDSQRVCLLNRIWALEICVNGVEGTDMAFKGACGKAPDGDFDTGVVQLTIISQTADPATDCDPDVVVRTEFEVRQSPGMWRVGNATVTLVYRNMELRQRITPMWMNKRTADAAVEAADARWCADDTAEQPS
jgi:hypothetical protein